MHPWIHPRIAWSYVYLHRSFMFSGAYSQETKSKLCPDFGVSLPIFNVQNVLLDTLNPFISMWEINAFKVQSYPQLCQQILSSAAIRPFGAAGKALHTFQALPTAILGHIRAYQQAKVAAKESIRAVWGMNQEGSGLEGMDLGGKIMCGILSPIFQPNPLPSSPWTLWYGSEKTYRKPDVFLLTSCWPSGSLPPPQHVACNCAAPRYIVCQRIGVGYQLRGSDLAF